ncbi:MAG: hypothetical protein UV40_C0015G0006 [Parcubacteria group bacterium GW2011_GWA1_42_7]|nr:MAG: hypothetical protein UV34_C0002G0003 [Parcubacteria group bacterium GW2011_GWB1_42_6]KKS69752.1 MAG: hypothetical protein UV40_C0015G0006 [Parcubacteria group bacterium GW2011_GWA1_42_7]KKS92359.1 MAG: hypothetical protein UV67_C0005G0022 [Parcubacteria group bacterium GW2011_GWC1_43_12]
MIKKISSKIFQSAKIAIAVLAMPFVVLAADDSVPVAGGVNSGAYTWVKGVVNGVIGVAFVLMIMFFVLGVFEYVRAQGDDKAIDKGKKHMIWGIIGMAIAAGAWGLVQLVLNFLGLNSSSVPVNFPQF